MITALETHKVNGLKRLDRRQPAMLREALRMKEPRIKINRLPEDQSTKLTITLTLELDTSRPEEFKVGIARTLQFVTDGYTPKERSALMAKFAAALAEAAP